MRAEVENLEAAIGYRFRNPELLFRALTHTSYVHEHHPGGRDSDHDNEQMEFLGDSVLSMVITEAIFFHFPQYSEGQLSKLRAHLVSATHLREVASALNLGDFLLLGRGEELSGGRKKRTLLVDSLEALIAAIYLDGGMEAADRFVHRFISGEVLAASDNDDQPALDHKSALQELAQSRKLPTPRYSIVRERGPEHSKVFTVEVRVGREWVGQAEGESKKRAAQNAAREVLARLKDVPANGAEEE